MLLENTNKLTTFAYPTEQIQSDKIHPNLRICSFSILLLFKFN